MEMEIGGGESLLAGEVSECHMELTCYGGGRVLELLLGNKNMGRAEGDMPTWMVCGDAGASGKKEW